MDTLSHALWGKGFFGYKGRPYWSLFFGALPDLFSFGIFFIITFIKSLFLSESINYRNLDLPSWLHNTYDITHSFLIAFIIITIVYFLINKNFAFAMLAWPLHILLDFPFHTADFFPTPILWPLIEVKFDGISWATPYIWLSNIAGLMILYIYRGNGKIIGVLLILFGLIHIFPLFGVVSKFSETWVGIGSLILGSVLIRIANKIKTPLSNNHDN